VYSGSSCEWIDLNKVSSNGVGCANGYKFVIKPKSGASSAVQCSLSMTVIYSGIRRQLLFVDGKTILAFVTKGAKFADCSSYTEVTSQVDCKVSLAVHVKTLQPVCAGRCQSGHRHTPRRLLCHRSHCSPHCSPHCSHHCVCCR